MKQKDIDDVAIHQHAGRNGHSLLKDNDCLRRKLNDLHTPAGRAHDIGPCGTIDRHDAIY
ncbi:hypothetical protein V22_42330 [Calycomorphotria hydatis]|uniref:Uncharacterized protein n=1 Tax=Calycomorphotria hydatis TaxID=2528027 RepID=A0A517TF08_9PLAN|nr:hypothetical protein V22_42330 [Calycomorphotria hydatis]